MLAITSFISAMGAGRQSKHTSSFKIDATDAIAGVLHVQVTKDEEKTCHHPLTFKDGWLATAAVFKKWKTQIAKKITKDKRSLLPNADAEHMQRILHHAAFFVAIKAGPDPRPRCLSPAPFAHRVRTAPILGTTPDDEEEEDWEIMCVCQEGEEVKWGRKSLRAHVSVFCARKTLRLTALRLGLENKASRSRKNHELLKDVGAAVTTAARNVCAGNIDISGSQFTDIGGDQINNYGQSQFITGNLNQINMPVHYGSTRRDHIDTGTVFDILKDSNQIAIHAAYNSAERESEHASTCQEGTREMVLSKLMWWSKASDGYPVCWLEGPAGSGKSTILHTIAKQCDDEGRLAFSFFFSRGKADRSDTAKVIPTFAYQLARSLPAIQSPLLHVLTKSNPFAPFLRLHDQLENLIINPTLSIQQATLPMVVIIDGLDECSDENLLPQLIHALVDATYYLPFRFLFASRPESHIRQTFESPLIKPKADFLSLRDFQAHHDVSNYLKQHLTEIHRQNYNIMQKVPHPWPSAEQLVALVQKSEGLFIYVSTLVKFVGDRQGLLPQEKLELAITAHHGVDPLYEQVLSKAQAESAHFSSVVGTIIYLHHPLAIHDLEQLLQLSSDHIRQALQGCQSIFVLPNTEEESVRPYHASLKDFLSDMNRAKVHFLDPKMYHVTILVNCLQLIGQVHDSNHGGQPLKYACQQWYYHFSLALSHQATIDLMKNCGNIEVLMVKLSREWLKTWMYGLEDGLMTFCQGKLYLNHYWNMCSSLSIKPLQREWKVVTESMNQILEISKLTILCLNKYQLQSSISQAIISRINCIFMLTCAEPLGDDFVASGCVQYSDGDGRYGNLLVIILWHLAVFKPLGDDFVASGCVQSGGYDGYYNLLVMILWHLAVFKPLGDDFVASGCVQRRFRRNLLVMILWHLAVFRYKPLGDDFVASGCVQTTTTNLLVMILWHLAVFRHLMYVTFYLLGHLLMSLLLINQNKLIVWFFICSAVQNFLIFFPLGSY
ncbi:hypothetical protein F5887DRAFT_919208 [Amanita rubescens]|nr:hypothetical protein F5887DRAFT_919208 [Amanita rubescens]